VFSETTPNGCQQPRLRADRLPLSTTCSSSYKHRRRRCRLITRPVTLSP
jgi:hypothetical protein